MQNVAPSEALDKRDRASEASRIILALMPSPWLIVSDFLRQRGFRPGAVSAALNSLLKQGAATLFCDGTGRLHVGSAEREP